jgi:hypothetical protein
MNTYGKIIDGFESPNMEVYSLIANYFDDPTMTKVKVVNGYAFYASRAPAMMLRDFRYIVAIVKDDSQPPRATAKLSDLEWVSFQTRTLEDDWRLSPTKWSDKNEDRYKLPITLTKRDHDTDTFYYSCQGLPIEIALLTPKKSFPSYQDKGTFMRALETFQTVIVFT